MRPQKIRITTFSTLPSSKNPTNPKSDIIQITPLHFPKKNFHSSVLTKNQKVHTTFIHIYALKASKRVARSALKVCFLAGNNNLFEFMVIDDLNDLICNM